MRNSAKSLCVSSLLITASLTLLLNCGCKPSQKKIDEKQTRLEQMADSTLIEIEKLAFEQKFSEAEKLASAALQDAALVAYKNQFLAKKLELLTLQDKTDEAEEMLLEHIKKAPLTAQEAVNDLFQFYYNNRQFKKCVALSSRILSSGVSIPETMLSNILNQHLAAAIETEQLELEKAAIDSIMTSFENSAVARKIIETQLEELIRRKKFTETKELADQLRSSAASDANYKNLAAIIDVKRVIGTQEWDDLKPAYTACVAQLPDRELSQLMRHVFVTLQKAGKKALLQECAKIGVETAVGKQSSVDYAAHKWIETQFVNNRESLPASIIELRKTTTSPDKIASIFDRFFYEVADNKETIKALCDIGPQLISACEDENIINALKVKVLDGAFIIEDYDLAVSMLEKGIPGKDEAWHAMSLPKVKAHRAQKQNKPRDAVKYYREFMECWINSDKKEEFDPTSGIAYSAEWILARNAKRIADILESIPDKAEAAAARAEAKDYFKIAIEKAKDDEVALKLVTQEAAKIE